MIVDVPMPTIVTIEPDTVATAALLDEYVIAPVPALLIGAVKVNGASVVVLLISANEDNVGVAFATVSTAVTLAGL